MNLDKVKYNNGRPYIEYISKIPNYKNPKRYYGQIKKCAKCGKDSFFQDIQIQKGTGLFCSKKCLLTGETNSNFKGGKNLNHKGYVDILSPLHPFKDIRGYVREHRLIIEKQIGRYLHKIEVVHHINKIKNDNRISNLMAFKTSSAHTKFERGKEINPVDIIFDGSKQ